MVMGTSRVEMRGRPDRAAPQVGQTQSVATDAVEDAVAEPAPGLAADV
jgi:hypothetical protein